MRHSTERKWRRLWLVVKDPYKIMVLIFLSKGLCSLIQCEFAEAWVWLLVAERFNAEVSHGSAAKKL